MPQVDPLTAYVTAIAAGASSGVDTALVKASAYRAGTSNALTEQLENLALPYGQTIWAPLQGPYDAPPGTTTSVTDAYPLGPGIFTGPYAPGGADADGVEANADAGLGLTGLLIIGLGAWLLTASPAKGRTHANARA